MRTRAPSIIAALTGATRALQLGYELGQARIGRALPGCARWIEHAVAVEEGQPLAVRLLDDALPWRGSSG